MLDRIAGFLALGLIVTQWASAVPSLPSGALLVFTSAVNCPSGTVEATELEGKHFLATTIAAGNVGTTGGSNDITPAGTIGSLTFTGAALSGHAHGVGTYDNAAASGGTPSGTNTLGAVSAHTGSAVADHASHTHSVTSNVSVDNHASHTHTYTEVPNHVHVQNINSATTGGTNGYGVDTSTNNSSATGYSTANPTGGVATGTTAGPSATLTHTTNNPAVTSAGPSITLSHSVTQPSNHTFTQPTFTGDALSNHDHTISGSSESVSAGTAAGTINTPAFTGTQFDNRSAFIRGIVCRVN